jgi:IS5 family transposase
VKRGAAVCDGEHPLAAPLTKVRYRGLAKNTAQLTTLFALSNLRMARRKLMAMTP